MSKTVLLGVTGSIAAYKSADLIRDLQREGFNVQVVMTRDSKKFITPMTLSALSKNKVFDELFEQDSSEMSHIELAKKCKLCLIAPATANIIAKLSNGFADDLLSSLMMVTKAPIVIAPAMNTEMYQSKAVQRNIELLKKDGVEIVEPKEGLLACGDFGKGHLADNQTIIDAVKEKFK